MAELEQTLGAGELIEWMAMDAIEPFGPRGDDLRAAIGTATIVNNVRAVVGGKDAIMADAFDILPWMRDRAPRNRTDDPLDPHSPNFDPVARAKADEAVFAKLSGAVR